MPARPALWGERLGNDLSYPAVDRAGDILAASLYIGFAIVAVGYVKMGIDNGETAAVLSVPLWPVQIVLPYAFLSSALRHFSFAAFPSLKPRAPWKEG